MSFLPVNEWLTTLHPTGAFRKKFPELPEEIVVRIIQYQIPGFRPSYLITNLLDASKYPWGDLVMLYHERWRQETAHADWKHTLTLSNLRSRSEEGILKEVYVQLTLNNAVRWMMADAASLAVPQAPPCSPEMPVQSVPTQEPQVEIALADCQNSSTAGSVDDSSGSNVKSSLAPASMEAGVPRNDALAAAAASEISATSVGSEGCSSPELMATVKAVAKNPSLSESNSSPELAQQLPTSSPPAPMAASSASPRPEPRPTQGQAPKPGALSNESRIFQKRNSPVRPVELRFLHTKRLVLAASIRMAGATLADIPIIHRQLLREILHSAILVRRGRHYPRRKKEASGRDKGHGKIAKSARILRLPGDEDKPGFIDIDRLPFVIPDAFHRASAMTI